MLDCLLKLEAHPDVIDFTGRTALMYAAEYGNLAALQLIREAEADATKQDFEGKGNEKVFILTKNGYHFRF